MSTAPVKRRTSVAAALLAAAAMSVVSLAAGPAPTASAHYTAELKDVPGPYNITTSSVNGVEQAPAMIKAVPLTGLGPDGKQWARTYTTNGVTAARSTASQNPQTILASYQLQRYDFELLEWVTIQTAIAEKHVAGFDPASPLTYPTVNMGSHWFDSPPASADKAYLRVIYYLRWKDDVTKQILGLREVLPDNENTVCAVPAGWGTCRLGYASLRWS